jgi:hypothetical protein
VILHALHMSCRAWRRQVECPFCSFAVIMPDANDRVLNCLNPNCMKPSCRLCGKASHIPLRCDEVESVRSQQLYSHSVP